MIRRPPPLTILIVAALLSAACEREAEESSETTGPVPVAVATARTESIRKIVTATGVVTPAPGAEITVTAPQSARIAEIRKAVGDPVQKGDVLVRFEIPALESDEAARASDLSRAQAGLESARAEEARLSGLFDRGIASRREVEQARREVAEAEATVTEARTEHSAAESLASRALVRAPFNGLVASRWHNPGDLVEAGNADPILRVLDPDRLEVMASVPLTEGGGIEIGRPARIFSPLTESAAAAPAEGAHVPSNAGANGKTAEAAPTASEGSVDARVLTRPAAVDPETAAVPVRLAFVQPTRLPAGTPVRVAILGEERPAAVTVDAEAIVRDAGETFVFVAKDGLAHRRRVDVGLVSGPRAEIRSGVSAGEAVIVKGQDLLPDGANVTVGP